MFRRSIYIVCCMLSLMSCSTATADNIVILNTLDWEPYIGQKLPDQGFVSVIVSEAFAASGYVVELSYMPWVRAKATAREGKADGCMPEYYLEEDKDGFFISDPFPGGPLGFFKRKNDPTTYTKLSDLQGRRIGVVRGYVNTEEFDRADYLQKEAANDDLTNIRKLMGGRLDLIVIDKFVGLYLLQQEMPDKVGEVEFLDPPLEEKTLHVLIAQQASDAEAKIKAFNEGLNKLKENGKIDMLMKRSGL